MKTFLVRFHEDDTLFIVQAEDVQEVPTVFVKDRADAGFLDVLQRDADYEESSISELLQIEEVEFSKHGVSTKAYEAYM